MEWQAGFSGSLGSGDIVARAAYAVETLRNLGVGIPQSSRLARAHAFLDQLNDPAVQIHSDDTAALDRIRNAQPTAWEFFIIAYAASLRQGDESPFRPEIIQRALKGAEVEEKDANPNARNTQFELYVAAVLKMGGADVKWGEPDLRLLYWGEYVGIAVKRLTSTNPSRLERRLVEAADQIARSGRPGFIAVNVDILFRTVNLSTSRSEVLEQYDQRVEVVDRLVRIRFGKRPEVKGVLVFGNVTQWDFNPTPSLSTSCPMSYIFIGDSEEDMRQWTEFHRAFVSRLDRAWALVT
jgi:hypothetical protein